MGPSSVGDLPPSRIVELLGNIYRYISKPTGSAGEDFAPTGIDLSSIVDTPSRRLPAPPCTMVRPSVHVNVGDVVVQE